MEELLTVKPKIGVFLMEFPGQLTQNNSDLKIEFEDKRLDKSTRILRLRVKNTSDKVLHINSFQIGQFIIFKKALNKVLENGWSQSSFSGYKPLSGYTKKNKLFLKRDQNPFSFQRDYGYLEKSIVNEWYTQLLSKNQAVVIGAVTVKEQYSQIFLKQLKDKLIIRITSQFDGLALKPGKEVFSEEIAIIIGSVEKSLEKFGKLLKELNQVTQNFKPPTGLCCTSYHQSNKVNERYVLEQLEAIDRIPGKLNLQYVQIDAGYSPLGDWLDTKEQFPRGMEFIVGEIKKRGMKAGIWIAPFVASSSSKLFQEHDKWFLKDNDGNDFEAKFISPFDFFYSSQLRVLDITHPEVQDYLTKVIKQFMSWGFELVKIDFTYPIGFCSNYFQPMTRVQAIRKGLKTIRNATGGAKTHIMSGITQLSPLVGLVDSARVGLNFANPFMCGISIIDKQVNRWMLTQDLRNCEARQFLNGKIWTNDTSYLVCQSNSGLSNQLLSKHSVFIANYNGSRWIGDHLGKLSWDKYENHVLDLFEFKPVEKPSVSIVVPAYNEQKTIRKTLSSLANQRTKIPFEVIFIDNNCTDNTTNLIKGFSQKIKSLKIIRETKQSIGSARESGFRNAKSKIIASTDADSIVPEKWVSRIFGEFWKDKKVVGLTGTYIFELKPKMFNWFSKEVMMFGDYIHRSFVGSFAFRGINFAIKKEVWQKAGGFNTRISALEDVDLSLRVGKLGKINYMPSLTVVTSYRRFEKRFWKQLTKRTKAYFYRVLVRSSDKHTDWETIR